MAVVTAAEKHQLIAWIHRLDQDKRVKAIVPEQFFEKTLAKPLVAGPVSFGWAYWTGETDSRFWLKTRWTDLELSPAEETLIRQLFPLGHRFFAVEGAPSIPVAADGSPTVSLAVVELLVRDSRIDKLPSGEGVAVSGAINAYLKKPGVAHAVPEAPGIATWLDSLETEEVAGIFVSRCVLNGYRPRDFQGGPVDMDAICLGGEAQELEFLEFKRKDSAAGMYLPYDGADFDLLLEIALRYNRKQEEYVRDAFRRKLFVRSVGCFGLDSDSHAPNVAFCWKHGIRYRYLIWDQSPKTAPSLLLTPRYLPRHPLRLKDGLICPENFHGISYSPPNESTAVGRDEPGQGSVRTQLMLDSRSMFTEYRMSPQLEITLVGPPV